MHAIRDDESIIRMRAALDLSARWAMIINQIKNMLYRDVSGVRGWQLLACGLGLGSHK